MEAPPQTGRSKRRKLALFWRHYYYVLLQFLREALSIRELPLYTSYQVPWYECKNASLAPTTEHDLNIFLGTSLSIVGCPSTTAAVTPTAVTQMTSVDIPNQKHTSTQRSNMQNMKKWSKKGRNAKKRQKTKRQQTTENSIISMAILLKVITTKPSQKAHHYVGP